LVRRTFAALALLSLAVSPVLAAERNILAELFTNYT